MNQQKSNGGEDGGAQWCRYLHGALWRRVKAPASGGAGEGGRGEDVWACVKTGFVAMPMRTGGSH
jgi:hypothetical protein